MPANQIIHTPALDREVRLLVDTATAAFHLNRRPQTLRAWASAEKGPIQPRRIAGRLAWPVDEIRSLLCGTSMQAIGPT